MNNKDLVLQDIERCKKMQPIMERLGIEPDVSICEEENYICNSVCKVDGFVSTYRQDKLALALPEWWFNNEDEYIDDSFAYWTWHYPSEIENNEKLTYKLYRYKQELLKKGGQAQLEATADLLILLEEEGLL